MNLSLVVVSDSHINTKDDNHQHGYWDQEEQKCDEEEEDHSDNADAMRSGKKNNYYFYCPSTTSSCGSSISTVEGGGEGGTPKRRNSKAHVDNKCRFQLDGLLLHDDNDNDDDERTSVCPNKTKEHDDGKATSNKEATQKHVNTSITRKIEKDNDELGTTYHPYFGCDRCCPHDDSKSLSITPTTSTISKSSFSPTLLKKRLEILDRVAEVQRQYLESKGPKVVYGELLQGILDLMDSEYGFISEVKYEPDDGTMYLHSHSTITTNNWDPAYIQYFQKYASGLKFYKFDTLFGDALLNKKPIISNNPDTDPRRGRGCPAGHPPLSNFLGVPFFRKNGDIMGMIAIANKPGGYNDTDIELLGPFTVTAANLVQAYLQIEANDHLINTLELKVQERTNKLQVAVDELALANVKVTEASAAQSRHFACIAHEIRTPLNCIIGLSSLLLENSLGAGNESAAAGAVRDVLTEVMAPAASGTPSSSTKDSTSLVATTGDTQHKLSPCQEEAMQMIVTSGDLLLTVVNDVLDYSKLQSGNVEIEIRRSNLLETLNGIVHSIEMKGLSKRIKVKVACDVTVPEYITTDSRRLQQILYNLLGNALKFSSASSEIELKVKLVSTNDTDTTITNPTRKGLKDENNKDDNDHYNKIENNSDQQQKQKQQQHGVLQRSDSIDSITEAKELSILLRDNVSNSSKLEAAKHRTSLKASIDGSSSSKMDTFLINTDNYETYIDDQERRKSLSCNDLLDLCTEEDGEEKFSIVTAPTKKNNGDTKKNRDKVLRFQVKDYGVGIAEKDFDRIFEPFSQAKAETERVFGGTGLGLAITSRLVQALEGKISVKSMEGCWSEFTVDLPFYDNPVDIDAISKKFASAHIAVIDGHSFDETKHHLTTILDQYNSIAVTFHKEVHEFLSYIVSAGQKQGPEEQNKVKNKQTFICLIHEDHYNREALLALKQKSGANILLFTFGPNFLVNESQFHFRKLTQVLPTVLMETLAKAANHAHNADAMMDEKSEAKIARRRAPGPSETSSVCNQEHRLSARNSLFYQELRILIAEDNKINQKVLCRMLDRMNIKNIDIVDNGQRAVEQEAMKQYDLILMDMQMPVMDGVDATKLISGRKDRFHPKPKIVFVTAHVASSFQQDCLNAGGDSFLAKPLSVHDIETMIHRLFVREQMRSASSLKFSSSGASSSSSTKTTDSSSSSEDSGAD